MVIGEGALRRSSIQGDGLADANSLATTRYHNWAVRVNLRWRGCGRLFSWSSFPDWRHRPAVWWMWTPGAVMTEPLSNCGHLAGRPLPAWLPC